MSRDSIWPVQLLAFATILSTTFGLLKGVCLSTAELATHKTYKTSKTSSLEPLVRVHAFPAVAEIQNRRNDYNFGQTVGSGYSVLPIHKACETACIQRLSTARLVPTRSSSLCVIALHTVCEPLCFKPTHTTIASCTFIDFGSHHLRQ